jgi:Concanavalin A-like lectin/glucanases superfamily
MSLTAQSPQPNLAWQFESSNVDYITGLTPTSQTSPGPSQLVGSAALVTNAPTSNTAVSFPGSAGSYMLINSTPATFDLASSNLFVECWVYFNSLATQYQCITADGPTGSGAGQECWCIRINPSTAVDFIINSTAPKTATSSALISTGQWYHIAASYNSGTATGYVFVNGGTPNFVSAVTPKSSTGASFTIGAYPSPNSGIYMNGYIRDLRVVQGGIVPTTSFTPSAAPFTYASPTYVANMGATIFTLLGQFITYVPGKYGQAISLTNNTGSVNTNTAIVYTPSSSISTTTGITISLWVNFSNFPSSGNRSTIVNFLSGSSNPSGLWLAYDRYGTGSFDFIYQDQYTPSVTFAALYSGVSGTTGVWYHLCGVLSSTNITLYLNGTSIGTPQNYVNSHTYSSFRISGLDTYWGEPFSGIIDDLRIYKTALSAAQVRSIYAAQGMPNRGSSGNKSGLAIQGTNYPFFTQLSVAGRSAAVGAFALRAVNAPTARAVQVRRSSDNATQDFWADRLGNLLTAPVTGQSLSSWLGGASGYVVTWYNQIQPGQDVTQATSANQPGIDSSNKFITFNGTSQSLSNAATTGGLLAACVGTGTKYTYTTCWTPQTTLGRQCIMEHNSQTQTNNNRAALEQEGPSLGFAGENNDNTGIAFPISTATQYSTIMRVDNTSAGYTANGNKNVRIRNANQDSGGVTSLPGYTALSLNNFYFTIGRKTTTNSEFLQGSVKAALVFSDALSDADVVIIDAWQQSLF